MRGVQLVGVSVVGLGVWLRADVTFHRFVDIDNEFNFIFAAGYVAICVGVVVAAAGALGIAGSVYDNLCILGTVRSLASRVVSVLDSGTEGPGFKSQPQCCWVAVSGKLFTPIMPLFTKPRNW